MNVPNLISIGRLLSVPFNVWLILLGEWRYAFVVFLLAGLSDALDGAIAKHFNAQSRLGRYLDPIADKTMLVAIFIALGAQAALPTWLVILAVSRDVLIVGGVVFLYLMNHPSEPRPRWSSKVNTVFQISTAALVLAGLAFDINVHHSVFTGLFVVTGLTTAVSGAEYLIDWGRRMNAVEGPGS